MGISFSNINIGTSKAIENCKPSCSNLTQTWHSALDEKSGPRSFICSWMK